MNYAEKSEAKIEAVALLMAMADRDIEGYRFLMSSLKTEQELRTALASMAGIALSLLEQAYADPSTLVREWAQLLVDEAVSHRPPGNASERRKGNQ